MSISLRGVLARALIVSALGFATACTSNTGPGQSADDGVVDFQTDSASYSLLLSSDRRWYTGTIAVTYTNRTADTVSFTNCQGATDVALEKLIDGVWTYVWAPVLPSCLSPAIAVAPGQERRWDIAVSAGYPGTNTAQQFSVNHISGVYRAIWRDAMIRSAGAASFIVAPEEHRVSNQFALNAPDP
ncbi:MAG TPA: hypothetical protein VGM67_13255 [Gemmatimonadaceae bacterium]|jgi:hypothetical protein